MEPARNEGKDAELAGHSLRAGGSPDMAQSLIPTHLLPELRAALIHKFRG